MNTSMTFGQPLVRNASTNMNMVSLEYSCRIQVSPYPAGPYPVHLLHIAYVWPPPQFLNM